MAELENSMTRIEAILRELRALAQQDPRGTTGKLAETRTRLTAEFANFQSQITADTRLAANPALRSELETRWLDAKQKWTAHQAKWRMVEVEERTEEHRESGRAVTATLNAFFDWARAQMAQI